MSEWTREERNQHQQVNHVVDMQAMAYIPRLYDIIVKSIDEDRKTNSALSKLENTFRAELRGYSVSMKEALNKGGKLTSNDYDDMKAHLEKVSSVLSQLEKEANTRHRKDTYANFNNQLAVLVQESMERVYQSMDSVAKRAAGLGLTFDKATKQIEKSTSGYERAMKKFGGGSSSPVTKKFDLTKVLPLDLALKAGLNKEQLGNIGYTTKYFNDLAKKSKTAHVLNTKWKSIPGVGDYYNYDPYYKQKLQYRKRIAQAYNINNVKRSEKSGALFSTQEQLKASSQLHTLFFGKGNPAQMAKYYAKGAHQSTYYARGGGMTSSPSLMKQAASYYSPFNSSRNQYSPYVPKGQTYSLIKDHISEQKKQVLDQIKDPDNNFFRDLHTAIGSLPFIGTLTGFASKTERGAKAGNAVGKILKILPGPLGKIGKAMGLIGAIATATGLIIKRLRKSSPVLDAVMSVFELAFNLFFMPFGNFLGQWLLPMAEDIINYAVILNKFLTDFTLESLLELFLASFQIAWGWVSQAMFRMPIELTKLISDWLAGFFTLIGLDGVANALNDFNGVLDEVYYWLTKWPTELSHWLSDAIDRFKNWIRDMYKGMWDRLPGYISSVGNIIVNGFKTAFSTLGSFIVNIFDKINLGDQAKGLWNDTIGNWTGMKLATGGVVTNPTIALVGEAGPEAVIPLDKAGGLGATYVININGDVYGVSDLESRIERVIQRTANKAYYR